MHRCYWVRSGKPMMQLPSINGWSGLKPLLCRWTPPKFKLDISIPGQAMRYWRTLTSSYILIYNGNALSAANVVPYWVLSRISCNLFFILYFYIIILYVLGQITVFDLVIHYIFDNDIASMCDYEPLTLVKYSPQTRLSNPEIFCADATVGRPEEI